MSRFLSAEPEVILVNTFARPFDNAVAAARTCYSSRGIISPEEVAGEWEQDEQERAQRRQRRDALAADIFKAGHHTVFQHGTVQFALSNVSRQFVWSFLHSHPWYNCLSGDTHITRFSNGFRSLTVRDLYERFLCPRCRRYVTGMRVRSVDADGNIVPNTIKAVAYSRHQPIYCVTTRLGYRIKATAQHRFMRPDGSFSQLQELSVGDRVMLNGIPAYKDKKWLRIHYHDKNLSQEEMARLSGVSPHTIRAQIRRFGLQKPVGSWTVGVAPHNKGKTKETYKPLQRTSRTLRAMGHQPHQGRGPANSNWRGDAVKDPRDRAKLWYKAEVCSICGDSTRRMERHHVDGNPHNNAPENILILCSMCHKQAHSPHGAMYRIIADVIVAIEYVGEEDTYDLEMSDPYHNFVAEGFVVHNSEQVSQRYVEVKEGNYLIPPLDGAALNIYEQTVRKQFDAYHALMETLHPVAGSAFYQVFPARRKDPQKWQGAIKKKALEIARYVLPVATFTYLYHTISCITLLRYWRLCQTWDTPLEQRVVVEKMVGELLKVSPEYEKLMGEPIPLEETIEFQFYSNLPTFQRSNVPTFLQEFDASLDGCVSKLIDYKSHNEQILAQSVREVLGVTASALSDDDAIALALDPARNWYLGETLNLTAHSKLTRALVHPHYTFRKKLSHTADSQDQRHRTTPGSRPVLLYHLSDEPDFITPQLVRHDERAKKIYNEAMDATWDGINRLRRQGVSAEFAAYLLPNAVAIRFTESADLASLWHKHAMRLCYNAQEEIWRASVEEAAQIREVNPRIGRLLLPPCGLRERAQLTPYCPEGKRYCGVPVWKLDVEEYERVI